MKNIFKKDLDQTSIYESDRARVDKYTGMD